MARADFEGIDIDDPKQVLPVLKKQRLELISGLAIASSRFGPDEARRVQADINRTPPETVGSAGMGAGRRDRAAV